MRRTCRRKVAHTPIWLFQAKPKIWPNPAKPGQNKSKELTLISLSESSLFKDLR
jgi:hypothetical protein